MPAEHPPIDGEQDVTGDFDVCVIGSGPAGALTTSVLVDSGLRVLLLEEGGRWPAGMTLAKAEKMWERAYVPAADGRLEPVGRPWTARAFGGGMTVFAGIFFRYRRVDFDARQHVAADAMDPRWPVSYDDLRGFYDEIERLVGVARAASADPCEPESDAPVMPPHPYSPPGAVLAEAGRSLGLKPFPTPLAINSKPYARRVACDRSTPCNGYVCPTGAKSNLAAVLLDPLRDSDLLTISTESKALRLTQTNPHRVDAVEWCPFTGAEPRHAGTGWCLNL